eukprot:s2232_g14.t1
MQAKVVQHWTLALQVQLELALVQWHKALGLVHWVLVRWVLVHWVLVHWVLVDLVHRLEATMIMVLSTLPLPLPFSSIHLATDSTLLLRI